jgi:hypothetical protein
VPRVDSTLIKALVPAHRWKRMLDDRRYGSVSELQTAEKLDRGYLGRILMLTLLAPDIVESIMDGRQWAVQPETVAASALHPRQLELPLWRIGHGEPEQLCFSFERSIVDVNLYAVISTSQKIWSLLIH